MEENLPTNLEFIYGPPGTGKTTELVNQIKNILSTSKANILVLAPTNKAADVVALKMAEDKICWDYLMRYGATENLNLIEEYGVLRTREDAYMVESNSNVVVCTAARYAYDTLKTETEETLFICDYPWDYIFIDEASMIEILTITYIIYKGKTAKKIIISGDPKQIQPVSQNEIPSYNIYDMINMHEFQHAVTEYNRFPVKCLMQQHRSVPQIGKMVSNFSYNGLLENDSKRSPQKPLTLDGIKINNVNFIGFDIIELDELQGLNSIGDSAFNLYAAIFTYNMVDYTIKQIGKYYPGKDYSIGIVCPYRSEANAIKNMLENAPIDTSYCKITCGTVHSFQGDECDIMFIVLNPPTICSKGAHINNENIINVAMSRARDYIFFVLPNGQPKDFFMKNKIGNSISMHDRAIMQCKDIEKVIFNEEDYIRKHTHVTYHMPINVYCEHNEIYEVRMSDDALDIKINK